MKPEYEIEYMKFIGISSAHCQYFGGLFQLHES
jgi:hypothetical protein